MWQVDQRIPPLLVARAPWLLPVDGAAGVTIIGRNAAAAAAAAPLLNKLTTPKLTTPKLTAPMRCSSYPGAYHSIM